tara:strand:- start:336 stop:656 length:321 start_codon:yes stop_codon:yes gene_type:complete
MPLNIGASSAITYTVTNAAGEPVNDATVTLTIQDDKKVSITGVVWPFTLPYVTESNGQYSYTFDAFSSIHAGQYYTLIVNVLGSDGSTDYCTARFLASVKNCVGGC